MRRFSMGVLLVAACGGGNGPPPPDAQFDPHRIAGGAGRFQAEVDAAASGQTVVVAFMDQRASSATGAINASTILVASSSDGGTTFSAPRPLDDSRGVDQFDPTVALRPDGTTIIGWFEDNGAGARHVRVAVAASPTGTFVLAPPLDDGSDAVDRPWLAVAPNGTIVVAWVGAPAHALHVARSTDGGATFDAPSTSTDTGLMTGCVAATGDNSLFVVADQYEGAFEETPRTLLARSRDGGVSFDPPVVLGTRARPGRTIVRCAAVPGTNRVAVAWPARIGLDDVASPTLVDADLFVVTSDGVTATAPVAVPAPVGAIPLAAPPPAVAADETGAVHVLFYGRRAAGAASDTDWEAFVATAPAGQALGAPRAISPAPFPGMRITRIEPPELDIRRWLGDTVALVAPTGAVTAVYSDNRTGDADLYSDVTAR